MSSKDNRGVLQALLDELDPWGLHSLRGYHAELLESTLSECGVPLYGKSMHIFLAKADMVEEECNHLVIRIADLTTERARSKP